MGMLNDFKSAIAGPFFGPARGPYLTVRLDCRDKSDL